MRRFVRCHTSSGIILKQERTRLVNRLSDCNQLSQNFITFLLFFDHPLDTLNVAANDLETTQQLIFFHSTTYFPRSV